MTAPLTSGPTARESVELAAALAGGPETPPPEPVRFPLEWLLEHGAPPVQYRAVAEVARLEPPDPERFAAVPYAYAPALALALQQRSDGLWNDAMLSVPSPRAEHFRGVGTIPATRRLLEYGWDAESPPLLQARRPLFRLLAEDLDPALLYELAPKGKPSPQVTVWGRTLLREAAAGALAHAGYERDPRLRGAARRMLQRLDAFLTSPLAEKPFVRVGNKHVLSDEVSPPSLHVIVMLAHMPLFRNENYGVVARLFEYLSRPQPRTEPAMQLDERVEPMPHLILGDPLPSRHAVEADLPWALTWLELMARLGMLTQHEGWSKLFDRLLEERDADGVWRPGKRGAIRSTNPLVWPSFPLDERSTEEARAAEVTFRLGLIARLAGRPIEPE